MGVGPCFRATLFLLGIGICHGLDILNFQDYCGATITKNAGELRFDAQKLPSYLPGSKCRVTISLQSALFNTQTQVLFYFTKFDISVFCEDTNVTVIDGTPYSGTRIKGLPSHICGHNRTLEKPDQIFTTSGNQLTVTFSRSDYGRRFSGNFSIKYVVFHTGTCEGEGTYKCTNGRCIPNAYRCSDKINACGDTQDNCTDDEEAAVGFFDSVLNILRTLLWIFAIAVGFYILRHFYRRYHGRIRSALRQLTSGPSQTDRRSSLGAQSIHLDVPQTQDPLVSDREEQPEQSLLSSGRISPVSETADATSSSRSSDIDCNSYHSLDVDMTSPDTQEINPTPSCPPPSYEDVMANK